MLCKAAEKEQENAIWQMWLSQFPFMTDKTFIAFKDYQDKLTRRTANRKQTTEEMIVMVRMLNAAFGGEEIYI